MKCEWSSGIDPALSSEPAPSGEFWSARWERPKWRTSLSLGKVSNFVRGVALYRAEPFWMRAKRFSHVDEVPRDTQLLIVELRDGRCLLIAPLLQAPLRCSLFGQGGELWATVDSGDPGAAADSALLAYVGLGSDLFALAETGARAVAERLGVALVQPETARSSRSWVDHFGWCTWEAFGQKISQTGLEQGLSSLKQAGVPPQFVILDDGWQQVDTSSAGEQRLAGLGANTKFPGGLGGAVQAAKVTYGAQWAFAWHAAHGYWGGIARTLPFEVNEQLRWYSPEVLGYQPQANAHPWGAQVGVPSAQGLERFYDAYHTSLAAAGVDGVKVDNQASIEALGHGQGGRVHCARALRGVIDASVARHFDGRVLHCMSCSTELLYAGSDGFTRSSMDFAPRHAHSHAQHLDSNALFGIWFGQFARSDWDMFLSRHPTAALHAAARAVSGGPVYVADAPGQHDSALLRTLVLADGRVLRARHAGRPTRDCVFEDPASGRQLFKIYNHNSTSSVLGLFNLQAAGERRGQFCVADVHGVEGDEFAVYLHRAQRLLRVHRQQRVEVSLPALGSEVVTIARVEHGFAALGLATHLNGGGVVLSQRWVDSSCEVELAAGGAFIGFCARPVKALKIDSVAHPFTQSAELLRVDVPYGPYVTLSVLF